MTTQYKGKVFKSGNSAAVRLPKDVAVALGTDVTIERMGGAVIIRAKEDPDQVRRDLQAMFDDIDAIWAEHGGSPSIEPRQQPISPNRPGLF